MAARAAEDVDAAEEVGELEPEGGADYVPQVRLMHSGIDDVGSAVGKEPFDVHQYQEIGNDGVWSLSSRKLDFGIRLLRDGRDETYWQSDGPQPHTVTISFSSRRKFAYMALNTSYQHDESYTPKVVEIRAGPRIANLTEVVTADVGMNEGWFYIKLEKEDGQPIEDFVIQLAVLVNHQNGKDTHLRGVRIYAPRQRQLTPLSEPTMPFSTNAFARFEFIR
ncbi:uncharacterized protein MONBRDRAFT_26249 [Monosiga brevicollis MX1]|uniref:DOC domain-containing protein n=1 Tax=Monosiga brevicollis TaxID=81824 RepID=A9V1T7_MONBE|nr:uncharacterized protein MONBRDRAFT_26249 [Monosiga brevicollis MX1]EDQ88500.1 predicted protein [Monosiga brevicollis MX1]|eukprot:XP_001746604.1 hypothetical protein [Monosiga brevicollis MX1]